jgi:hypothetical protein
LVDEAGTDAVAILPPLRSWYLEHIGVLYPDVPRNDLAVRLLLETPFGEIPTSPESLQRFRDSLKRLPDADRNEFIRVVAFAVSELVLVVDDTHLCPYQYDHHLFVVESGAVLSMCDLCGVVDESGKNVSGTPLRPALRSDLERQHTVPQAGIRRAVSQFARRITRR